MLDTIEIIFSMVATIVFLHYLITKDTPQNTKPSQPTPKVKYYKHKKKKNKPKALNTRTFKNDYTSNYIEASWEEIQKH